MTTDSSASRACSASASASLATATVRSSSSPSQRMTRTEISPRLATRSVRMPTSGLVDRRHRVTRAEDGLVVHRETGDPSGGARLHLGELLHHLDQADRLVGGDVRADLDEHGLVRRRTAVEDPEQWGADGVLGHGWLLDNSRVDGWDGGNGWDGWDGGEGWGGGGGGAGGGGGG